MTLLTALLGWPGFGELLGAHALALTDRLAEAMVSAIWEGALLAAAFALAVRLFPGLSAALRTRLWLALLLVLVVLPVLPAVLPRAAAHLAHHGANEVAVHPLQVGAAWSLWLAGAWLVLSAGRAIELAAGAFRLRQIARAAVPVDPGPACAALLRMGGRRVVLCVSDEVDRPSVVGFLRPRVLLPPSLFAALAPEALRQVVLHEMEHLRRHDDWTNLVQKVALVLLPLHPALFWVERRLCVERELACDDGVLRATADEGVLRSTGRKAYAACLVSLAEHAMLGPAAKLALGAWERQSELARRVLRILRRPEPTLRPAASRLAVGALLGGVLAGGALLAGMPQLVTFVPVPMQGAFASARMIGELGAGRDELSDLSGMQGRRAAMRPAAMLAVDGRARLTLATAILKTGRPGAAAGHLDSTESVHGDAQRHISPVTRSDARRTTFAVNQRSIAGLSHIVGSPQVLRTVAPATVARPIVRSLVSAWGKTGGRHTPAAPHVVLLTIWQSASPALGPGVDGSAVDAEEISPSYAAVPMQGGWLLVQL